MNDTISRDWWVCNKCKAVLSYGTWHNCDTHITVPPSTQAEILHRLDKIIVLLERLTK